MERAPMEDGREAIRTEAELTDREKEMLDQRLESYQWNPSAVSSWEVVKKRILGLASQPGD